MSTIRRATEADVPGIRAIYNEQIEHGTATFDTEPFDDTRAMQWFRGHDNDVSPAFVAHDPAFTPNHGVLGWSSLSPWSDRCAYRRAAEVSVYIHAEARGKRLGTTLLKTLLDHAPSHGVYVLFARIAEGNPVSLRLHHACGFRTLCTMARVGEKFGRILDVDLLSIDLEDH